MDFVQTINAKLATPDWTQMRAWFSAKEKQATAQLDQEKGLIESVVVVRSGDARFEGQGFNTEVIITDEMLSAGDTARFHGCVPCAIRATLRRRAGARAGRTREHPRDRDRSAQINPRRCL
jgi:hypothetical protein